MYFKFNAVTFFVTDVSCCNGRDISSKFRKVSCFPFSCKSHSRGILEVILPVFNSENEKNTKNIQVSKRLFAN